MQRGVQLCCLAAATLLGCQMLVEEMPESPAAEQPSGPTIVLPILVTPLDPPPQPASPAPTPEPEPQPEPPASGDCSPGTGTGSGDQCRRVDPEFLDDVHAAIDRTVRQYPGMFDLTDTSGEGGYRVLEPRRYHDLVVATLGAQGLCAAVMGYEEIAVKSNNNFGEGYDILLSSGHIRRGLGSYRGTCWPAWF